MSIKPESMPNQAADHVRDDARPAEPSDSELTGETLIEEISIDGMCGVY